LLSSTVNFRFAFIDHIISQPSLKLPVVSLIKQLRAAGVEEICVDGAHGIGSIKDLDVPRLGCDYYFTNLHKWGFCPISCLLWSRKVLEPSTHHPIPSWKAGLGIKKESQFCGTRDYSSYAAIPSGLDFLDAQGEVEDYNQQQVTRWARELQESWCPGIPLAQPEEMIGPMCMVQLPPGLGLEDNPGTPGGGLRGRLRDYYNIEAAIVNFGSAGCFLRLSHQVYNSEEEYIRLRDAVLEEFHKIRKQ